MQHEIDVRHAAQRFSEDTLSTLYSGTVAKIHEAGPFARKVAHATFAALLCLHEPLSSAAFVDALKYMDMDVEIQFQPSELPRICHYLVVFDTKLDKVRFAHTSIQEFFQAQSRFSLHTVNSMVTKACLNAYLYGSPVGLELGLQPRERFYHYGALYWPEHYKQASPTDNDLDLWQVVADFIFDDNDVSLAFCGWLKDAETYSTVMPRQHLMLRDLSSVPNSGNSPVFTAAVFGLVSILNRVIQSNDFDVEQKNDLGATGLYLACACGHQGIVSVFLEHGADPNAIGGKFGCPLQAACFNGSVNIAKLLLSCGADPKRCARFDNALQASLEGGSEELALTILGDRSRFNIPDQSSYDKALQMAAQVGHAAVVRHLQGSYPAFGHSGPAKCQAIQSAISKGQLRVLQPFIDDTQGQRKDLPAESIAIAALYGQDRIIHFLLEKGFDIEQSGPFGKPVRAASLRGHDSTVRLLIDRGASASASDSTGNALEAAAMNGHTSIAAFLLQNRVDPDARGGLYGTALQAAAFRGSLGVAKLLLDAGAHVYQPGSYWDALHAAAAGGSEEVMVLLLDRGFQLQYGSFRELLGRSSVDPYKNLLAEHEASYAQHDSTSRQTGSLSFTSKHVLAEAASHGHHHVVELILRNLHNLEAQPESCGVKEAMLEAASRGYEKVVHTLLESGHHDLLDLRESLKRASQNGHVDCVKTLVPCVKPHEWNGNDDTASRWNDDSDSSTSSSTGCRHEFEIPIAEVLDQRLEALHPLQHLEKKHCHLRDVLLSGCRGDHIPIVELALGLLSPHCSAMQMHQVHIEALLVAAWQGSIEVMDFSLRKLEIDLSFTCSTIRPWSHSSNSEKGVQSTDCDLDHIPRHGGPSQTLQSELNDALIYAAHNGHLRAAQFLLSKGSDAGAELQDYVQDQDHSCLVCGGTSPVLRVTPLRTVLSGFEQFEIMMRQSDDDTKAREALVLLLLQHGATTNLSHHDMADMLEVMIRRCTSSLINEFIRKDSSLVNTTSELESALQTAALRETGSAAAVEVILQTDVGRLVVDNAHESLGHRILRPVLDKALAFFSVRSEMGPETRFDNGRFIKSESIHSVLNEGPGADVKMLLRILPGVRTVEYGYALLMQMALAIDDRECVDLLLRSGIDVNKRSHYYGTALQCASRFGRLDLVRLLLMKGAEVNIVSGEYDTAIRAAVLGGHDDVVNVLIEHGAHVNLRESDSEHILSLALHPPQTAILKSLTTAAADIHHHDTDELDFLNLACELGDISIVKLLLNTDCDACHRALSGLEMGVDRDKNVNRLLPRGGGYRQVCISKTPLQAAARAGHASIVLLLVEAGASMNYYNFHGTALSIAAEMNRTEAAKVLLRAGANIYGPSGSYNALKGAARYRNREMVQLLLDELSGSQVEEHACTDALSAAAATGDEGICRMLLASGALVSSVHPAQSSDTHLSGEVTSKFEDGVGIVVKSSENGHALHVAAYNQHDTIVSLLLALGADPTHSTPNYGVPIQAALEGSARHGHRSSKKHSTCESIVRELLEYSADVNPPERGNGSLLQLAADHGDLPIVQLLLENGADVGQTSECFGTALMAAAKKGSVQIAELLLQKGADVNQFHVSHGTALQVSSHNLKAPMVEMLLSHGADASAADGPHGSPLSACLKPNSKFKFGLPGSETLAKIFRVAKILLRHTKVEVSDLMCALQEVRSFRCSHEVIDLLFEHEKDLCVTEGTLVAEIENLSANNTKTLCALLRRDGGVGVTKAMIEAVKDIEALEVLLKHRPICQISPQSVIKITRNRGGGQRREMVELLLNHESNLPVDENFVLAVLGTKDYSLMSPHSRRSRNLIDYLLDRNYGIKVTQAMLKAAASPDDMRSLLNHAEDISVTMDILQCAADRPDGGHRNAQNIVRLLLAHDLSIIVEQPVLDAFSPWTWDNDAFDYLNLLLERGPDLRLTAQLFLKVSTTCMIGTVQTVKTMERFGAVFEQHGKIAEFTDGDCRAIAENNRLSRHPELLALAYRLGGRKDWT